MDAFQMLDTHKKGWITAPELLDVMQEFGQYCHKDDVYTFVRRWDNDSDGRLLYSDFCDAFSPKDPYCLSVLNNRHAEYIHRGVSRFNFFNIQTRDQFFRCFKKHFEIEESIELCKKRLQRRPKFNVHEVFRYVDVFEQ